jgi:CO dehydrogenase maturation factor
MTITIAVAGKGGTGKTTVASMIVRYLAEKKSGTILAIDADPSSNLHSVLGLELAETIGEIREDMRVEMQPSASMASTMPGGMSKQDYLDYQVRMALVEGDAVDLLAMGRPEGQGCYCAANHMLRNIMDRMGRAYDYVVMDNEAGMEHISRRTTRDVDHLVIVTDPSQRGVEAARRIMEMIPGLEVNIGSIYLVVNRLWSEEMPAPLVEAVKGVGAELVGTIPNDPLMAEYDLAGKPLVQLPAETPVVQAVYRVAERILSDGQD